MHKNYELKKQDFEGYSSFSQIQNKIYPEY